MHNDVPCAGTLQGGICDQMCRCEPDEDYCGEDDDADS